MARWTMYVRDVCDMLNERNLGERFDDYEENIKKSIPYIFKNFPIFDENHREQLCEKILTHYYMREICMETYEAWLLKLNERMRLIMPRYNEKYKTLALDYEILQDVNVTTTVHAENHSEGENQVNRDSKDTNLMSDTPQMNYADVDYATELNESKSEANEHSTSGDDSRSDQESKTSGINGHTNMSMINEYRQNIINVDEEIVNALSDLFMSIYDRW